MSDAEIVIADVTVVDGTGVPGYPADVALSGDRILGVSQPSPSVSAPTRVDGNGLVLTPGFIDVHSHDDIAVLAAPDHRCKILQGVTSVVVGNCGTSPAPASDHTPSLTVFDRMGDYFDALEERAPAVNVAALVGHGAIRAAVMGLRTSRAPDAAERVAMLEHLVNALDDGAIGLSSGLAYEPGRYAAREELVAFNQVVAAAGGIYATHMRDESDRLVDSIEESVAVADSTGVRLQISHLKAAGRGNWGAVVDALACIDAARARGVDVMADQYPYTRGSSLLEQIVNGGALDGPSPFGHVGPEQVHLAAAPRHPAWEGRSVSEIAALEGVDPRVMADRIVEAEGRACIAVIDIMSEDDVQSVMRHDSVMIGSDGLPWGDKPHPRLHHTFPRVLGRYVREQPVLGFADAVRRMTSTPANRFGFAGRGEIRAGAFADLVLLDPETVADTGTYQEPMTVPAGIVGVWVNGRRVVDDGEATGERPGRVIRRSQD